MLRKKDASVSATTTKPWISHKPECSVPALTMVSLLRLQQIIITVSLLTFHGLEPKSPSYAKAFVASSLHSWSAVSLGRTQDPSSVAFLSSWRREREQQRSFIDTPLQMCICVNCAYVTNCSAYHFVETKHEQPHMTDEPTFTPRDGSPTIHVNVRTVRYTSALDQKAAAEVDRLWHENAEETARAAAFAQDGTASQAPTVYDLTPVTTYEYDVVACADYVKDVGCWVRNMPEEIRRANPDFVPS